MRFGMLVLLGVSGCAHYAHQHPAADASLPSDAQARAIVIMTDFGMRDGAVAAMKGVARELAPSTDVYDLTHDIPPFDIWEGAYRLDQTIEYWPKGTVFVVVVDPGVGTERRSVVLETRSGHVLVGPDNGLFTLVADRLGVARLHLIDADRVRRPGSEASHTFHGRDVFVVVAARICAQAFPLDGVGPALEPKVRRLEYQPAVAEPGAVRGTIPVLDPAYGNVWTNVDRKTFETLGIATGERVAIAIEHDGKNVWSGDLPYVPTFGAVPEGEPLVYLNSRDAVALAINMGSFAGAHAIGSGPGWRIRLARAESR